MAGEGGGGGVLGNEKIIMIVSHFFGQPPSSASVGVPKPVWTVLPLFVFLLSAAIVSY